MTIGIDFDDSKGVAGVNATTNALDSLIGKLGELKGAGKSLEEMRRIIVGIKGQGSVFQELARSVQGLNEAAASLRTGFTQSISDLAQVFKHEMTGLRAEVGNLKDTMLASGRQAGQSFDDGLKKGIKEAVKTAEDGVAKIAKAAKKEIVGEYSPYNAQTARTNTLTKTLAAEAALHTNARAQQAQRGAKWDAVEIAQLATKKSQMEAIWNGRDTDAKTATKAQGQQLGKELAMNDARLASELLREKAQVKAVRALYDDGIREAKRFADEKEKLSKAPKAKESLIGGEYSPYNAQTSTATFLKSVVKDTAATNAAIYRNKMSEAKKVATEESAFARGVESDTKATHRSMYAYKVNEAKKADAGIATLAKGLADDRIRDEKRYQDEMVALGAQEAKRHKALLEDKLRDDIRYQAERVTADKLANAKIVADQKSTKARYAREDKLSNSGLDKNARFNAAGPASQLQRAVVVNNAINSGMPSDEAARRYGSAALTAATNIDALRAAVNRLNSANGQLVDGELTLAKVRAANAAIRKDARYNAMAPEGQARIAATARDALRMGMPQSEALKTYGSEALKAAQQSDRLGSAMRKLTIDGNDAHSMARGLASGFNLLWLTWGNLLPLFAGAGISFGLKKTFDIGSEVEYQIKFMEILGQTTKEGGAIIRQELRAIDQETQFSLIDLTKAMVDLQQAGRTAGEALAMMRPSAALAALGQTDLKTATNVLNSSLNAFSLTAKDSDKVAAQIFNATKLAPLTVTEIGESIKYASEVNVGYGQSLSEVLTLLGSLSKVNIKGTSGGTSIINFMRDIAGRSAPAIKALDQLRKTTGDSIKVMEGGKFRPMIDIISEMGAALKKLDPEAAIRMVQKMTSDRGIKSYFATMREGAGSLREMQTLIEASTPEDMFKGAKGLMDTTKGALDILKGALVGALDQVFEAHSEKFKSFILDITAAISSDAFKTSVYGMVQSIMTLYDTIKLLMPVILTLGSAWAVFKVAGAGIAIFQGLSMAIGAMAPILALTGTQLLANTAAMYAQGIAVMSSTKLWQAKGATLIGTAVAAKATAAGLDAAGVAAARAGAMAATASGGMRLLAIAIAFLSNPIVGVIATLAILGGSWWLATKDAEGAMSSTSSAVLRNGGINIEQWNKEIAILRERNSLMGKTATDAYSGKDLEIASSRKEIAKQSTDYMAIADRYEAESKGASPRQQEVLDKRYKPVLKQKLAGIKETENQINQAAAGVDSARMKDASEKAEKDRIAKVKADNDAKSLMGTLVPPPSGGKGKDPFNKEEKAGINYQLEEIRRISGEKVDAFNNAERLMEASRTNGYIGDKAYYAQKMQFLKDIAKEQESALEKEIAARKTATFGGPNAKADTLTNAAEILKTEAKLSKTHTENTTAIAIMAGQADEAFQKIIQGYKDAQRAAEKFLAEQKRGNERELAGYGKGSLAREDTNGRDSIGDKYRDQVTALETAKADLESQRTDLYNTKYTDEARTKYETELALAKYSYDRQLSMYEQHLLDKRSKEKNWSLGQSEAINNYQSEAANVYKQVESVSSKAYQGMEDNLVSFVTTGKADFGSLAASIISDIVRIMIKQQMSNAMGVAGSGGGGILGTIFKAALGAGLGAATGGASGAYSLGSGVDATSGFKLNANGNVFQSASLSAYSGQIVDTPTTFAFAKGAGLMGEAGPEAIMPLRRGADGKLGVASSGGQSSGGDVTVNVTVDASGAKSDSSDMNGNQLGAMIGNAVRSVLLNEKRPGGMLA